MTPQPAPPPPSSQPFHSLTPLPAGDALLFTGFGRGPPAPIPHRTVHAAFEAAAAAHPLALAVRDTTGSATTYAELDRRANALANQLVLQGVVRGSRVVLLVARSLHMCVGLLAVLKAGAQYVPLDGGVVAADALAHILEDTGCGAVLTLRRFRAKVAEAAPRPGVRVLELDGGPDPAAWRLRDDERRPEVGGTVGPEDGAYVIYTSGTTGKPKGVDVRHGGVTNTLLAEPSKLGICVGKNVAQLLSVSFDMGAWEILGTLMNGGTLHIRSSDWAACLRRVDTVIATPSVLAKFRQADFPNITTIAVGGEPCPRALAEEWAPHARFWNVCGPTEISILNTGHLHVPGGPLTIGKPNPNTNVYILDDDERPVRIGEPGLMWVGGSGVSRGYLNLPELTAQRYKPDKFTQDGRCMFNTGDLGRWLEDGSLEHLGRKDEQVKIKGFRVELDGVSAAMEKFPSVTKACALLINGELWGFYSAPSKADELSMKGAVAELLPYYAVPTEWRYLPRLELTPNGKVDKRILKNLVENESTQPAAVPEAKSHTELVPYLSTETGKQLKPKASEATLVATETPLADIKHDDTEKGIKTTVVELDDKKVGMDEDEEDDHMEKFVLPAKNGFHGERWLRHRFFSMYRRFFSVIFLANLSAFIVMLWKSIAGIQTLPIPELSTAVTANLMVAVLMRQEHMVNVLFWLATRLPTSTPLWLRRQFARVFHIGGVHSGCAISATMWWIVFTAAASVSFSNDDQQYPVNGGMIILTYLILMLLVTIVVMAYPAVREATHDQFEWTHRFAGWTALTLVWAHLVVSTHSMSNAPLGPALTSSASLWMLIVITGSIALPWLNLRRVRVRPEPLSRHAVRLHFDWCTPTTGKGIRISDRPLVEWHAFAAINQPGVAGFSVIVSRAGDWTSRTIDRPPRQIWTRGVPAAGVLTIAPLFKKMVLVATGSGIGPCMPVIMEKRVPVRVLWSTPHPIETFGQDIMDAILASDPKAVIWNTRTQGKPDLVSMAYQMYRESGAEAVGVISNKKVTQQLVYRLESRGVPAFGPVFDS